MKERTRNKLFAVLLVCCLLITGMPSTAMPAKAVDIDPVSAQEMPLANVSPAVSESDPVSQDALPTLQLEADTQIFKHIDEEAFRQQNHVARLAEEESLSTYVFMNRDGTKTVYYLDEPVKYRDSDGSIKEKNIDLIANSDGYRTTQNDVQLSIPRNPASGVQMEYGGYEITLIPQGSTSKTTLQVADNTVGYVNYYGKGTVLKYTPTLSGVKEDIILSSYTGISSFAFLLKTDGLRMYQADGRYYLAPSADAETKIWLGEILVYDAMGKPDIGSMTVATVTEGQQYQLTVRANTEFLTAEDTVYPVTIDPTLTVSDNTHGANAIQDASIFQGMPTTNFGNYTFNRIGNAGGSYGIGRTVVRLNGLLTNNIYQNASVSDISSAYFYIKEASGLSPVTVNLHPLTTNTTWTETGVTWNNVGSWANVASASTSLAGNAWGSFNISTLVRNWKTGTYNGNAGFILISASESTVNKAFCSSEYTTTDYRPYVVVNYVSDSMTLTYSVLDVAKNASRRLFANNVAPNVSWVSSSPSIATVDQYGNVEGKNAGIAIISASAEGYATKTCLVYVHEPVTLTAKIYYDSSCTKTANELRNIYNAAAAPLATCFGINFNITTVSYSSSLNCPSDCHAPSIDALCTTECAPIANCLDAHHRSANRPLAQLLDPDCYTCRFVGYRLCSLINNTHATLNGAKAVTTNDIVVTEQSDNIQRTTQHELSHNFGAPDYSCSNERPCVMTANSDKWCDACATAIRNYIAGMEW